MSETVLVDREGLHLTLVEDPDKPYTVVKGFVLVSPSQKTMDKPMNVNINVKFRVYVALEFTSEGDDLFWSVGREKLSELEGEVYREVYNELPSKIKEFVSEWFSVPLGNVSCDPDPDPSHVRVNVYEETKAMSFDIRFDFLVLVEDITLTVGDLWGNLARTRFDPETETFFVNTKRKKEELKELILNYFKEKFSNSTEWLSRLARHGIVQVESKPNISNTMVFSLLYNTHISFMYRNLDDMFTGGRFQPAFTFWEIKFTVPVSKGMAEKLKEAENPDDRLTLFFSYLSLMRTEEALRSVGGELNIEARNLNVSEPKSLETLIKVLRRFVG